MHGFDTLLRTMAEVIGTAEERDADDLIDQDQLMSTGLSSVPWPQDVNTTLPVKPLFF